MIILLPRIPTQARARSMPLTDARGRDLMRRPPTVTAPYWLLWCVAIFDKDVQGALKRVGKMTKYDNSRSKEVLGVEYTDLKQVRPTFEF